MANSIQKAGNNQPTTIRWYGKSRPALEAPSLATAKPVDYIDAQLCWSDDAIRRIALACVWAWFLAAPVVGLISTIALAIQLMLSIAVIVAMTILPPPSFARKPANAPLTAQTLSAQNKASALAHNKRSALGSASAQRLSAPKKRLTAPNKRLPQAQRLSSH
jgi:hypothetical protein